MTDSYVTSQFEQSGILVFSAIVPNTILRHYRIYGSTNKIHCAFPLHIRKKIQDAKKIFRGAPFKYSILFSKN